jgi:hypothetical protein
MIGRRIVSVDCTKAYCSGGRPPGIRARAEEFSQLATLVSGDPEKRKTGGRNSKFADD